MIDPVIEKWIEKEYPDGKVNWRKEYERLHHTVQQGLDSRFESHAAKVQLKVAAEVGDSLLIYDQSPSE